MVKENPATEAAGLGKVDQYPPISMMWVAKANKMKVARNTIGDSMTPVRIAFICDLPSRCGRMS